MAVPEEVYTTGPSQEQIRAESEKIKGLLERLQAKLPIEDQERYLSDYKKLEGYLSIQLESQATDLGKALD
jgi:hypothetical protein